MKLSMIGYGPGYVMDYKRQHQDFPHQSTSNQIYDEAQFEAYRALGEAAGESFFSQELMEGHDDAPTVNDWFIALATSLYRTTTRPLVSRKPSSRSASMSFDCYVIT